MTVGDNDLRRRDVEIALLKRELEYLTSEVARTRVDFETNKKEFDDEANKLWLAVDDLKESRNSLIAKGSGGIAAIVALGAVIAWLLNFFNIFRHS